MRLNLDCIREVLIWLQDNQQMQTCAIFGKGLTGRVETITSTSIPHRIEGYSAEDILYSIHQMIHGGLLMARDLGDGGTYMIEDISPHGHEFLENIRNTDNWETTKKQATQVGSFSLSVLANIAANLITKAIQAL